MNLDPDQIDAVLFDYGNTLIEFARDQIAYCDGRLAALIEQTYGPFDRARFDRLRQADRVAPYRDGFCENDLAQMTTNLVRALFDREPDDRSLSAMIESRFDAFVTCITAEAEVLDLLSRLHQRYKLGLVSNYPCGRSVRASLERTQIASHLDVVVVSGDVGLVKPHPRPFEEALGRLGVEPARALYVGDNWLGDVQGAKRLGMRAAFITRYDTPEKFDRQPGDHEPDLTIAHLSDLEALLGAA
jgi:putative hydrolase of the HAD superfamily